MDALDKVKEALTRKRELTLDRPRRSKSQDGTGRTPITEKPGLPQPELPSDPLDASAGLDPSLADINNLMDLTDQTNPFFAEMTQAGLSRDESKPQASRPQSALSQANSYDPDKLFSDPTIKATLNHPWGKFMLPRQLGIMLEKTKKIDMEEAKEFCREFNSATSVTREELELTINKKATDIAEEIYKKMVAADRLGEDRREKERAAARHFSPYLTQAGIKVPDYFSPVPTLLTENKVNVAYKAFPSKFLFNGKKAPNVEDFLEDCTRAQANLQLSRTEFEGIFIRCMSGEPQVATRTSFRLGHSIEQVYKVLTMSYNNLITPEEANAKLCNLKAPKTMTLPRLITTIQNLAGRATANYILQSEKDSFYNTTCIEALQRCLPEASQSIISNNMVRVTTDIGRRLNFLELTMVLYPHTKIINTDIERNGVAANHNGNLSIYVAGANHEDKDGKNNKNNNFKGKDSNSKPSKPTGSVNEISVKPADKPQPEQSNQQYKNNKGKQNYKKEDNKDYHIQNGSTNKKYCSACGQNNHSNSDGCKLLRDDLGRVIQQGATSGHCDPCHKKLGKQLLHPENLCPGRPAMMKLYRDKKVYPKGFYKKIYEDWLESQPDNHANQPTGRINMIQFAYNTGKASILAVDTTGLEFHDLTRKVYLTLDVARPNLPGEYHITGMYDTAADQTIISRSYFAAVFEIPCEEVDTHLEPSTMELVSYSGHKISVSGEITLLIKLTADGPHRPIKFIVVADTFSKITPLIIGMTAIRQLQLSLSFNEDEPESPPFVYTLFNPGQPLNSHYLSDLDRQTASHQHVYLQPGESKFIPMIIPHFFGIYPDMEVILSEDNLPNFYNKGIKIYPTKSELKLNEHNTLTGYVYVTNLTTDNIDDRLVVAYLESADIYDVKDVDYNFPHTQQVIHEIGLLSDHTSKPSKNTDSPPKEFGTVNRVQIDLTALPVYAYTQKTANVINIIQKTFPEQDGFIANPQAINNDVPEPNISLSDMRSSIEEVLEPAHE